MATLIIDGFDKYGPNNNTAFAPNLSPPLAQGGWTLVDAFGKPVIAEGLSATGYSVQFNCVTGLSIAASKTLPGNFTRLVGGFRFYSSLSGPCAFLFYDNSTPQCSIVVEPLSGFIAMKQANNGTLLQQSTASVAANTVHYLEFDVTFSSGSLGGWTVWLDGVQILLGTGTTQQSGNNYANVVAFSATGGTFGETFTFDDFYLFDSTTALNNAVLLSNPAVITQFEIADHQTQFANLGNVFGNSYSLATSFSSAYSFAANTLYLAKFTPNVNCTVNSVLITAESTNNLANFKGVIYSDNAGVPNALLSTGTQVTGCVAGSPVVMPLITPQALTAGTPYWIGLIGDSSVSLLQFGSTTSGYRANNTYGSGAPGTAPTMTAGQLAIVLYGSCVGAATNWESEALNPPIGDLSSVSSAVVATSDLYVFPAIPSSVTRVYSVGVSGNVKLSEPGVHTFDLLTLSGATLGAGSNTGITPTIDYAWYDSYFDTDPNTSVAWAPIDVTNGFYGMSIVT